MRKDSKSPSYLQKNLRSIAEMLHLYFCYAKNPKKILYLPHKHKLFSTMRYIFLLFIAVFAFACTKTSSEKKPCPPDCGKEGAKPCPKGCIEAAKPATPVAKLRDVNFYIETSASMGGYLNGGTQFKNVITDLIATTQGMKKDGKLGIFTISEKITAYPGSSEQFIKDIATVPLANQKSSEMHKIFKLLADNLQNTDVSIFTSDCILSFPPADVKKNPRINVDNAESTLKSYIKTTFQGYQQKGIVINVFAFTSPFNGKYYDFKNTPTSLTGKTRPYYIWVMGKKELVGQVCAQLKAQPGFKPEKELNFGFASSPVSEYMIVPSLAAGHHYKAFSPYKTVAELELAKGKKESVYIALNVSALGSYVADPAYLKANLQLKNDNKVMAEIVEVKTKEAIFPNVKNAKERELMGNDFTHVVKINISEIVGEKGEICLHLPYKADTWYEDWTTMDDSKVAGETKPQTFAFKHLVNGVKEAYQSNSSPYILEVKLAVSK